MPKANIALQKGVDIDGNSLAPANFVAPNVKAMQSVIKIPINMYLEFILENLFLIKIPIEKRFAKTPITKISNTPSKIVMAILCIFSYLLKIRNQRFFQKNNKIIFVFFHLFIAFFSFFYPSVLFE